MPVGLGAAQMGLTSAAVGAATLPEICGVGLLARALPMNNAKPDATTSGTAMADTVIRRERDGIRLRSLCTPFHRRPPATSVEKCHEKSLHTHAA
jgi:hypothetical protein